MNKFTFCAVVCSLIFSYAAQAQLTQPTRSEVDDKFEIHVQSGYHMGGLIRAYEGDITLQGGAWYGGAMQFKIQRDVMLELNYMFRSADATIRYYGGLNNGQSMFLTSFTENLITVGGLKTFRKDKIAPFIGGNVGVVWYTPEKNSYTTETRMAVTGIGGVKIFLSDRFGIRLQGRLIVPISWAGLGFWCGSGGCSSGVSGGSTFVEGEFGGGVFLAF